MWKNKCSFRKFFRIYFVINRARNAKDKQKENIGKNDTCPRGSVIKI